MRGALRPRTALSAVVVALLGLPVIVTWGAAPASAGLTPPDPPVIGVATPGDSQATVAFAPPGQDGGSPVTGFTVATSPADVAPLGCPASPCVVTGLTNGVSYTFTVTATNSVGTSAASSPSNGVVPKKIQTITFPNPGVQDMNARPSLAASSTSMLPVAFSSVTPAVCAITVLGDLTPVGAGTCTIAADQPGDEQWLAAAQVRRDFAINAVPPNAPVIGSATAGDGSATVSFLPGADGGAVVTGYTVTATPGGATGTCWTSPCTLTGLTNGVPYTFTVTATNSAGTSGASSSSNSVVPRGTLSSGADADHDGLSDAAEAALGTDASNADTDGDGLGDGAEHLGLTMTKVVTGCDRGRRPIGLVRTDPRNADTDADGLLDGREVSGVVVRQRVVTSSSRSHLLRLLVSNPAVADTDGDGLRDKAEDTGSAARRFSRARTDPASCHTDRDRRGDGYELAHGTNPVRARGA